MKEPKDIHPNYGAVYCAALYPHMAGFFQKHGYALAVHGSLAKDFDLVAIPWAKEVTDPRTLVSELVKDVALRQVGSCDTKEHGRLVFTLSCGFGTCYVDLSFWPMLQSSEYTPESPKPPPTFEEWWETLENSTLEGMKRGNSSYLIAESVGRDCFTSITRFLEGRK